MSQLAFDGTGQPTPPELRLTTRQRLALEAIAEQQPVSSEELGAIFNPRFPDSPWNKGNGAALGARLREMDLVRFSRKHGGWVLAGWKPPAVPSGQSDEIPF